MLTRTLPASLAVLLASFRPCFTAPTFTTFTGLCCGFLAQTGQRTVTGMLVGARLSGRWSHDRAHGFFARARWSADQLGLLLVDRIITTLLAADTPIRLVVDDTLMRRSGRKVFGAGWHHDPLAAGRGRVAWGNNWVVLGILVDLPFVAHRSVCLPVLARLWRPKRTLTRLELGVQLATLLASRYPDRAVHLIADAAYAGKALQRLPGNVTVTVRLRADAALFELPPPRTGRPGRPRVKGDRLPELIVLAGMTATRWQPATITRYGRVEHVVVSVTRCLWPGVFGTRPVQVVLVRDPAAPDGYELALASTDPHATGTELVERYAARWNVEVCFEEARQLAGVGQARNRTRRAVERTIPFELVCFSVAIVWYAHAGQPAADLARHRALAPWYQTKDAVSTADMLAAFRRALITAQYQTGLPVEPTTPKIPQAQAARAAAAS
jgi:DDE superfamily endonuclease